MGKVINFTSKGRSKTDAKDRGVWVIRGEAFEQVKQCLGEIKDLQAKAEADHTKMWKVIYDVTGIDPNGEYGLSTQTEEEGTYIIMKKPEMPDSLKGMLEMLQAH